MPEAFVKAQIEAVLDDFPIAAIKLGMLFSAPIIQSVMAILKALEGRIPVVLDPVAISRAGSVLLDPQAREALLALFGYATVATPNAHEFEHFIGQGPFIEAAQAFVQQHPCAIVAKNRQEENRSTDWLFRRDHAPLPVTTPIAPVENTHGTGCTFAAALTALLALGHPIEEATKEAKAYVYAAINRAPGLGRGNGPIGHHG